MENIEKYYHLNQDSKIIDYSFLLDRYYWGLSFFAHNRDFFLSNLDFFADFIFHFSNMHDGLFDDLCCSKDISLAYSFYRHQKLVENCDNISFSDQIFMVSCLCFQRICDFQLSDFMNPVVCEMFLNSYKVDQVLSKEYIKKTM